MKIIEEAVTLETVTKYKDELFLFNEKWNIYRIRK